MSGGFLEEIDRALVRACRVTQAVVDDDASTDDTRSLLQELQPRLDGELEVLINATNQGHGPTLMTAYRQAVVSKPDYVLQIDGDGQFLGGDLRRVLFLLLDQAHAVSGVRRFRQDPWFRMTMTRVVRQYLSWAFSVRARDPNCPLRGYEAGLLGRLLEPLAPDCLTPNLYLTILAAHQGIPSVEVDVSHRVRRGACTQGATWGKAGRSPVPWRLVQFSLRALNQSIRFRKRLRR